MPVRRQLHGMHSGGGSRFSNKIVSELGMSNWTPVDTNGVSDNRWCDCSDKLCMHGSEQ